MLANSHRLGSSTVSFESTIYGFRESIHQSHAGRNCLSEDEEQLSQSVIDDEQSRYLYGSKSRARSPRGHNFCMVYPFLHSEKSIVSNENPWFG
jgi:hypothetical protein